MKTRPILVSFDLFDCLLARAVFDRHNNFVLAFESLAGRYSMCSSDLASRRIDAELRLGRQTRRGRPSLPAICQAVAADLSVESAFSQHLFATERQNEIETCYPIEANVRRFRAAERDDEVAVIADTCHDRHFVSTLLHAHGIDLDRSRIFSSADEQLGDAYAQARAALGGSPRKHLHHQAGRRTNRMAWATLGMRIIDHADALPTEFELHLLDISRAPGMAVLAGAARKVRIEADVDNESISPVSSASQLCAVALVPFSFWLLRSAAERGLGSLIFLGRDGQLLHRVAETVASEQPMPPLLLSYCAGSRLLLYPLALLEHSDLRDSIVFDPYHDETLEALGRRLNLPFVWTSELGMDRNSTVSSTREALQSDDRFWRLVEKSNLQRATLARSYIEAVIRAADGPHGIVDIGWSGRVLRCFDEVAISVTGRRSEHFLFGSTPDDVSLRPERPCALPSMVSR